MTNELITPLTQTIVDGKYKLGAVIRRSVQSTIYETEVIDDRGRVRPAVIRVRERNEENSESKLKQWRDAMQLTHPNLLRLFAAGSAELDGAMVEYVVIERADESLAGVLAERPLSEGEVREMLGPAIGALQYLHKKGYAHGSLRTSNVMAVGDQLKLSTDSALRFADGGLPEADMQAFGALISEALGPGDPPERFLNIIQHCRDADTSKRWTADQLADFLNAPPPEPQPVKMPELRRPAHPRSRRTPRWVFAGLAALVLIVLGTAALRNKRAPAAQITPAPIVTRTPPPVNPAIPPLSQAAQHPLVVKPAPHSKRVRRENGWSVIVAAYGSRDAAEKRMRSLAGKWPDFHPSVQEQRTEKAPYVVVLGENLSEDAAQSLRQRAVSAGLPRDTYIKRLM